MTHEYSIQYPVLGGPSKWDLMLGLFDREHDVRALDFVFGSEPLPRAFPEPVTWSLAVTDAPDTFKSKVWVISVKTFVTIGESYHIEAHVTVPEYLFAGRNKEKYGRSTVTMLAEIYFQTHKRKGNVRFKVLPEQLGKKHLT